MYISKRDFHNEFTKQDLEKAFLVWQQLSGFADLDLKTQPEREVTTQVRSDWLTSVRKAQMLSFQGAADKLEISKAAYMLLEKNETSGKLSLKELGQAAGHLDCELVYFLRPKHGTTFSRLVWDKILPAALNSPFWSGNHPGSRGSAFGRVVHSLLKIPAFRKKLGLVKPDLD